jgi:phenylalanyl-tRNA synthetase beta chain
LDGQEHQLDQEMCLICDSTKAVALAGVMGGMNSEIQPDTQTIYLESAYFETTRIRRTSKTLGLSTESSRRFERGANPNATIQALNRASQLLMELAGATLRGEANDEYPVKIKPLKVPVSVKKINQLLGTHISKSKMCAVLAPLEISIAKTKGDRVDLLIPTFRPDVTREIDIVEEVGRLYGYDNIPQAPTARVNQLQVVNERIAFADHLRMLISGFGLKETVSLSLVTPQVAKLFLPVDSSEIELLNPLSAELSVFRPSLLISILTVVAYNRNRQSPNLRLFEIGNVAWKKQNNVIEKKQVVALLAGKRQEQAWYGKEVEFDFYDVKGLANALLDKLGIRNAAFGNRTAFGWDAESVSVDVNGSELGCFGKISREICDEFKIRVNDLFAIVFDFETLYQSAAKQRLFDQIPRFPSVPFDLAILADIDTPVASIETGIRKVGGPCLRSVQLFDFYKGEQVPSGKKSLAFSLTFTSKERTLDDKEVDQWVKAILTHLKNSLGAELRPR